MFTPASVSTAGQASSATRRIAPWVRRPSPIEGEEGQIPAPVCRSQARQIPRPEKP